MKILLAHPYLENAGGAEKYLIELANQYVELGHDVTYFTLNKPTSNYKFKVVTGKGKKFLRYDLLGNSDIAKLRSLNPDLIHVNSPLPFSSHLAFKMKSSGIPIISTYQAHINPSSNLIKFAGILERNLYRFLFKKIITTSHFYQNEVCKFYPSKNITAIPLGIYLPTEKIHAKKAPTSKKILFVGAMDQNHYYKGVEYLIETAKKLPEFNFRFVGDGDKRASYENQAKNLRNCVFLGRINEEKLTEEYKNADLLVLPSTTNSEGYGLVLLESLSYGTPIITTSVVGSSHEIKQNHCGIIVKPRSSDEIAKAIKSIYENHILYSQLSQSGLKFTSELSWKKTAEKTLELYANTIKVKN